MLSVCVSVAMLVNILVERGVMVPKRVLFVRTGIRLTCVQQIHMKLEQYAVVVDLMILKHALDALRLVALEQEKRLLVLQHRIVFVLQTFVLAPMALKPQAKHVPPMLLTFVRTVPTGTTTQIKHALVALRVILGKDKRLLALQLRIVFVIKTFVRVPMAL